MLNKPIKTQGAEGARCNRCGNYSAVPALAETKTYYVCLTCGYKWEV